MNNTPTPRTDEFSKTAYDTDIDDYVAYNKAVAFAQNLERELTAALDASTQWEAEAWRSDELLEQRDNELTAAREELVETRKDFMCLAELLDGHDATECRMNLVRLKEQRDRLEEALANIARQNLSEEMDDHSCERADWQGGYESIVKIAREAIQSLNQPTNRTMNDTPTPTPTPRTDDLEFNLIEFCYNQIRFPKMSDHARKLELELTAVTEQRDRLEKQRDLLIEVLEVTLNATVLNHRRDRWHSDAEYALNKIKLNLKYE